MRTALLALVAFAALTGCDPKPGKPTAAAAGATQGVSMSQAPNGAYLADPNVPQAPPPGYVPNPNGYAPVPPKADTGMPGAAPIYAPRPYAPQPGTAVATAPVYNDNGPPPPGAAPAPRETLRPAARAPAPRQAAAPSNTLGQVTRIEEVREKPSGSGAGGVAGGVIGGLVGNQFGGGAGRTALTVLGVAGGALAGNEVEKKVRERTVGYRVQVRLDNGESRTVEEERVGDLRVGDRVKVSSGGVHRV